ncbi:XdhC family protein [Maribacter chungangensis]|uniref:XdhC family protein n=1 Tax=Maribacter chungangensis TaxID=1069117 RepID=A0ABW3B2U0_9FLAO
MTHEFKKIVEGFISDKKKGLKSVLATVVALDGSSYRRPGVRMGISENGELTGAVSGGCVEKEVVFQAASVFKTGSPKMMTYDGRFRLGCEGILYILLEPFDVDDQVLQQLKEALCKRTEFAIASHYKKEYGVCNGLGSIVVLKGARIPLRRNFNSGQETELFSQEMKPIYKLVIIGGEHDAVKLSYLALGLGWEVVVATVPSEDKQLADFPGIDALWNVEPELLPVDEIDAQTAVVLMTHSYVKDLKYLKALKKAEPMYFGLLGPTKRREKLFGEYMELYPEEDYDFFDAIYGPAGLNIGAEAPEEIAVAILAEILTVIRKQEPMLLRDKKQGIHN